MGVCELIAFTQFYAQNLEIDFPNDKAVNTFANASYLVFANSLLMSYIISAFMSFMLYKVIVHHIIFKIDDWRNIIIFVSTTPSIICFTIALVFLLNGNSSAAYTTWLVTEYLFWIPVLINTYFCIVCHMKIQQIR